MKSLTGVGRKGLAWIWESDSLGGPRGQIAVFHSVGLSPEACGT